MVPESVIELRRDLHRHPELSGYEAETARRINSFFAPLKPDRVLERIGGHGLAFVFDGSAPGPTLLLRCDMDALPVAESADLEYASIHPGVSHKCGHDGHMAVLALVGSMLADSRPRRGRVVLLYQPAEETGMGAAAVVADPRYGEIRPDFAIAMHNLPGYPLGQIVVREGEFSSASRGVTVRLTGATAHAAEPETGRSPTAAMCEIIAGLTEIGERADRNDGSLVTVIGSRLGDKAFGTAPGRAEIWATLRSGTDTAMAKMTDEVGHLVSKAANNHGLEYDIGEEEVFAATANHRDAVDLVLRAAGEENVRIPKRPFPWSEDFGVIAAGCRGALFGMGAGDDVPALHDPRYDFPDALISRAADVFLRIVRECLR